MEETPRAPGYVRWIAGTLEDAGYETWAVGGAIRNTLLGRPSGDWDLTTRAPPPVVRKLFPRTVPIGVEHGTVGVLTRQGLLLEVTTFRRDVETTGRHAVVEFADTLDEDLARRDFTINAIAWHPLREEFRDPFRGRRDLAAGLLRTVGDARERFSEDYLRVLRGLRFSGRFGFRIRTETWRALCEACSHLDVLSPERVREELMKTLSEAPRPSSVLALYAASGVLDALYPEVARTRERVRSPTGENLWVHSLLLADLLPVHRPLLRLAALLEGAARTPADGEGNESPDEADGEGAPGAAALLFRLRFSNADVATVTGLLEMGLEPPLALEEGGETRRWLHDAGRGRMPDLARIWLAKTRLDALRGGPSTGDVLASIRRLREELRRGPALQKSELALSGRDLISMGLKPGPHFGEILSQLMERVLDEPRLNENETLRNLVREMVERAGEEGREP
jgi:tRNA nucleotidyltransferase/poly(A) polymerase